MPLAKSLRFQRFTSESSERVCYRLIQTIFKMLSTVEIYLCSLCLLRVRNYILDISTHWMGFPFSSSSDMTIVNMVIIVVKGYLQLNMGS
jgi:hypothetical protein